MATSTLFWIAIDQSVMRVIPLLVVLMASSSSPAQPPSASKKAPTYDFVLIDEQCKIMMAALVAIDPNAKQTTLDYQIAIDTAASLRLANATSSEAIYGEHTAISSTRTFQTLGDQQTPMVAMKMCKGYYLTYDEAEALNNKKP